MGNIQDGAGTATLAKVNENHQLYTRTTTLGEEVEANGNGDAYNINTGEITLTNDTQTPVLYIKNNEPRDLIFISVVIGLGASTGGTSTDRVKATFIRNPTTGTIVSGATNVDISSNRNYGSQNTLDANAYKGATGNTMTNGDDHIFVHLGTSAREFIAINEILPKGSSFGLKITPQSGNTSMDVYAAVICYLRDSKA